MAHHSRLAGVSIDCRTDDLAAAARFWAAALGGAVHAPDQPGPYVSLDPSPAPVTLEVQRVGHESRVHLDIAADDVPAEVARLERLGARRHADVRDWVVMEAPTGQRFCVIPARHEGFAATANRWEDAP
jgi:catechol 2,3-dioxygenase-like lactoylglutathione lyase family enzyme